MSAFDLLWSAPAVPIADEVDVIAAAKTGDEAATLALFAAYVPAVRRIVARFTSALPLDDARQTAFLGFLDAVEAFNVDRSDRLASILREKVYEALSDAAGDAVGGFAVPSRTLKRYFGILRRHGGDPEAAALAAPSYEMAEATFRAVHHAVNADDSLDAEIEMSGGVDQLTEVTATGLPREFADVEDAVLVAAAFRSIDDFSADVCRLKYGFTTGDEMTDDAVGYHLGVSRLKAHRTRATALRTMADALGASNV